MLNKTLLQVLISLIAFAATFGCTTSRTIQEPLPPITSEEDVFKISRTFDADIEAVFKMWINPIDFSNWLGPTGAKMSFIIVDVKEGGTSQWVMTTPDGLTKYGKLNYKIISPSQYLIYTQNFCDKAGNLAKLPISSPYPDVLLTTVSFVEAGPRKTIVNVKWEIFGKATATERQTFRGMKPVMTTGWGQSFDKLDSLFRPSHLTSVFG